ncbi:jg12872 [Pararge aegeria aegeria]|uniref:Jg12872 protein n=1 Tax=Pararge aegeria aegeria TaxID=348720 RepID=A0A8S4S3U4_9NEOP|nr:jg12872 [Pararge aegeria aegeria]
MSRLIWWEVTVASHHPTDIDGQPGSVPVRCCVEAELASAAILDCIIIYHQYWGWGLRPAKKAGAFDESAQSLKRRKYYVICNDNVFAALAFEILGQWSSDTKYVMNIMSQKLVVTSGDPRAGAYLAQRLKGSIAPAFWVQCP